MSRNKNLAYLQEKFQLFKRNNFFISINLFCMDSQKSSLVVAIQSAEFAKEFHYFITCNFDGDQEKVLLYISIYTYISNSFYRGEPMSQLKSQTQSLLPTYLSCLFLTLKSTFSHDLT